MLKKVVTLCGLLFAFALCSGTASGANHASGVAAVHAADDAWIKAYNAGQVEKVVALYDESAVVYPPGVMPSHGRAAIQAFFTQDMAEFAKTGLTLTLGANPNGGVSGDMGWSSGTWELKDKAGKVVDTGWYFSVSRKKSGKWLYVRDAWDSDKPAAPTAPAGN